MRVEQLQEGVLCSLKMGRWDASIRMNKNKLGKDVPKDIVRAMQDMVDDRTLLKDMATIRRMAKGILQRHSIPFPIDGILFVPKEKITMLDEKFNEFNSENDQRLKKFLDNYGKLKKEFKNKYPDYYNESKYPSKDQLKDKFYFHWQFFQIAMPDKKAQILSPKMYKREQDKLANMVKQMEEMTISMVGNMLFRRVKKLSGQCDSGKINSSTFNSVESFLKRWDDLWKEHVDEKKLTMIMAQLKREMKNANVERLKDNEDFRTKMNAKLESTMKKIKNIPNFTLKRKLDI
jgi:hypothetical protein